MKRNRTKALIALLIAGAVFSVVAFADSVIGSGYDNFKAAIKKSAACMEKEFDSYSFNLNATVKINDKVYAEEKQSNKTDVKNKLMENITKSNNLFSNYNYENYSFSTKEKRISKSSSDDTYFVYDFSNMNDFGLSNPFNDERFEDVEKIFDAAIGSLKNNVNMEETADGQRIFSGNIEETQIPALINAVASFAIKQGVMDSNRNFDNMDYPKVTKDIMINSISGKAVQEKEGYISEVSLSVEFSGSDEGGTLHTASILVDGKVFDVNKTVVQEPDLTGKKIENVKGGRHGMFSDRDIGTYKNNIVTEENTEIIKIGERVLVIEKIEDENVIGKYYEVYKDGYGPDIKNEFSFIYDFEDGENEVTNIDGTRKGIYMSPSMPGKINFNINNHEQIIKSNHRLSEMFDPEFIKVFE